MKPEITSFPHEVVDCSLQMCDEEAIQWLEIVDEPKTLYLCEEHTVDSEEFPETAVYSCDEKCPVCKDN